MSKSVLCNRLTPSCTGAAWLHLFSCTVAVMWVVSSLQVRAMLRCLGSRLSRDDLTYDGLMNQDMFTVLCHTI